jgi:aldose 1-epimerase
MFAHSQTAFGQFIAHHIKNEETNTGFSIVPAYGGIVLDVTFQGISILDGYQTPIELDLNNWGKSALLYPFPNRLRDGKYNWNDLSYQFPINDQQTDNALHGLGMTKAMNVVKVITDKESGTLVCQYMDQGQHEYYPFPFHFCASFTISESGMAIELKVTNTGDLAIPFGFGWHPYFSLSKNIGDTELTLPSVEMIGIDPRMIPTGKRYTFDDFATGNTIDQTVLDNCFAIPKMKDDIFRLQLKGEKGTLDYWQETGPGKYEYIQLFTPPMRQSIAIEPMTCNVDAFNNGDGLIEVVPGEEIAANFGFNFEKANP